MSEVWRTRADGAIPTDRYTSAEFAAWEHERLWSRVWQIAGREEQIPNPGDVLEYEIGDRSVLVVRDRDRAIRAVRNSCRHRGTKVVVGTATGVDCLRCPYHGWRYDLAGRLVEVVDRDDFGSDLPADLALAPVAVGTFGGFVFVNLDLDCVPLVEFLGPLVDLLAPYRMDEMRLRLARTTVLPANWKAVVDAFNEGYHVQALHPQILPWTDDTSIAYEQFDVHARYGRLPGARRELRGSPRLDPGVAADEGEILLGMVAGLGGAFLKDERAVVEELIATGPPPWSTLLGAFQSRRRELMTARGFDVTAFADDELTSAQDAFWFPNFVGPIYPGSAILFRVRPNGTDPHTAINDTWVLEWPDARRDARPPRIEFIDDWDAFAWDPVTRQDYDNLARVQAGMRTGANEYLFTNPRQESNVVHLHRVIDRYLFDA